MYGKSIYYADIKRLDYCVRVLLWGTLTWSLYSNISCFKPYFAVHIGIYDSAGRLLLQETPFDGNSKGRTEYEYDDVGNPTQTRVSSGAPGGAAETRTIRYAYDSRSRLILTASENGTGTEYTGYEYDAAGNQTAVLTGGLSRGGGVEYTSGHTAAYDRFGNVVSRTDGLGQTETYSYDSYGLLLSKTDRNGRKTSYGYDALGRAVRTEAAEWDDPFTGTKLPAEVSATAYTLTGQIREAAGADGSGGTVTLGYVYDSLGLVMSETEKSADGIVKKSYSYDLSGNRVSMELAAEDAVMSMRYEYDELGRLESVTEGGKQTASYRYDKNGKRTSQRTGPVNTSYAYNDGGLVTGVTNTKADGSLLSAYSYEYSLDGNQVRKADHKGKVTRYSYDGLGRLLSETSTAAGAGPDESVSYGYDANGNRTETRVSGAENYYISSEHDAAGRLIESIKTADNGAISTTAYTYDPNGNQRAKTVEVTSPPTGSEISIGFEEDTASVSLMNYDGHNRMTTSVDGATVTSYTYRPDGMRHSKTTDGKQTTHIWDGSNIVYDLVADGTETAVTKYLRGAGLIARQEEGEGYEYYLKNGHGDITALTDASGDITREYDYDAFGVELDIDENDTNVFRYCGEYYDNETETYYLRARYYAPRLGRFTSQDSAMDGNNWYVYCSNKPIIFVDPDGKDAILVNKKVDNAASEVGIEHSAVFLQDENGTWFYFSWEAEVKYMQVDDAGIFESMDAMNQWLVDNELLEDNLYESSVYIEGKFSASNTKAAKLKREYDRAEKRNAPGTSVLGQEIPNGQYDLLTRNCGQVAMALIGMGTLPSGTNVGDYISSRRAPKNDWKSTRLINAGANIVMDVLPNANMANMQSIFYNEATNYNGFSSAMQAQRDKYEGKGKFAQQWYSKLKSNIDTISSK